MPWCKYCKKPFKRSEVNNARRPKVCLECRQNNVKIKIQKMKDADRFFIKEIIQGRPNK